MDKIKKLLAKGFFPSQLPPAFSTQKLAEKSQALLAAWPTELNEIKQAVGEHFSVARVGHSRRPIIIPNPVNQLYLSKEIVTQWDGLNAHFKKSKISISRPSFGAKGRRAVNILPLSDLSERRLLLSAGYRYVLRSDISRFYPSIYTHSIPWALHGKAAAKANTRDLSQAFFGNVLDRYIQRGQARQTIGVAIGPDTSHIISEIISTAIDLLLRDSLGAWPVGYRHVDDYFLCFNSLLDAEKALTHLRRALREYELDINPIKTAIIEIDQIREDE